MANFNPITKPLLNVSGPVDTRSVARQQDFYSEENTSGFNVYEGLTFYDKGEKSLKYVTEVETDEDGMTSIKGTNSIFDSTSEEGLRKLIEDVSHRNHLISRVPLCA